MSRKLEETLQALYNSEINVTISTLWDGGYDFSLRSTLDEAPAHNVAAAFELADALHEAALKEYPESTYARARREPGKILEMKPPPK